MFCLQKKKKKETGNKFLLPNCSLLKLRLDTDSHHGLSGSERLASNLERDCFPVDQTIGKLLIQNKEDVLFTFVFKYDKT